MIVYADTSFVVKLYVRETGSRDALRLLRRLGRPLTATWFTVLETANTLRLLQFRKQLEPRSLRDGLSRLHVSIDRGAINVLPLGSSDFARRTEELSESYTAKTGVPTLDLMHLAAATLLQATVFLTYDERQRKLAATAGLQTAFPIKRIGEQHYQKKCAPTTRLRFRGRASCEAYGMMLVERLSCTAAVFICTV